MMPLRYLENFTKSYKSPKIAPLFIIRAEEQILLYVNYFAALAELKEMLNEVIVLLYFVLEY